MISWTNLTVHDYSLYRCTSRGIEHNHICASLSARNSLYGYLPQQLSNGDFLSSNEIGTGFALFNQPPPDPNCASAYMHIFCLAALPPCSNTTDRLLPICHENCLAFNRLVAQGTCDSILESLETFQSSPATPVQLRPIFGLLNGFDCRNSSTYYFSHELNSSDLDSERCTGLFTLEQTGKWNVHLSLLYELIAFINSFVLQN